MNDLYQLFLIVSGSIEIVVGTIWFCVKLRDRIRQRKDIAWYENFIDHRQREVSYLRERERNLTIHNEELHRENAQLKAENKLLRSESPYRGAV